jgi:hypothetical protein
LLCAHVVALKRARSKKERNRGIIDLLRTVFVMVCEHIGNEFITFALPHVCAYGY